MRPFNAGLLAAHLFFGCAVTVFPGDAAGLDGVPASGVEFLDNGYTDDVDRVIGWEIQSVAPMIVGELGVLDFAEDGLVNSHEVGLWTLDGTLLVSGVVPAGSAAELHNNFRYVDVADTLLPVGHYIIGSTWPANGDEIVWTPELASAPGYDVGAHSGLGSYFVGPDGSARLSSASTFVFPSQTVGAANPADDRRILWGPNFTRVPEPCSAALAAMVVALGTPTTRASRNRR